MQPSRRPFVGLIIMAGIAIVLMLIVARTAFFDLLAALWFFLDTLGAGVIRLGSALWEATPLTLRPLWGLAFCGAILLMMSGLLALRLLRRLRDLL
jgi:hypothetical protein